MQIPNPGPVLINKLVNVGHCFFVSDFVSDPIAGDDYEVVSLCYFGNFDVGNCDYNPRDSLIFLPFSIYIPKGSGDCE